MVFAYDESGAPIAIHYRLNGSAENVFYTYYLEKNLQGDIIALYNASGTKLVGYTYDAWGNCTTTYYNGGASTGAQYNPFKYRGYYYDADLGLYYLNSRYYDSNTGRFINEDAQLGGKNTTVVYNLFSYCGNNPIRFVDEAGYDYECFDAFGEDDHNPLNDYDEMAGGGGGGTYSYSVDLSFAARSSFASGGLYGNGYTVHYNYSSPLHSNTGSSSQSGKIYYHATTYDNALSIKSSKTLKGSLWEGGYVYAWTSMPSSYAIKNSGARSDVVISFSTNASFTIDTGITNPNVTKYGPVVSSSPGPISIWDVTIVRGK